MSIEMKKGWLYSRCLADGWSGLCDRAGVSTRNVETTAGYVCEHDSSGNGQRRWVKTKGHATRNDIVDDIVDFSSSTMAFNVAKIASVRASLTISLTKSLRVAGP